MWLFYRIYSLRKVFIVYAIYCVYILRPQLGGYSPIEAARMATPSPVAPPRARPRSKSQPGSRSIVAKTSKLQCGGHNYQFTNTVPEKLICEVCTKPLYDPHLTICCGQHFCEICLKTWFLKKNGVENCPHCRAEGEDFQHVLDKKLRREVDSLQIFCPHKSKGCKWMGEVSSLKQHFESMSGCGFVELDCPNKCKIAKLKRNTIDNHLKNECENRPSRCQFCGYKDIHKAFKDSEGGHYTVCPELELECSNKCGVKNLKRKELEDHQSVCQQESVQCPFKEAGCKVKSMRCDLEQHMSTKQQEHLLMVMGAYKEMKGELQRVTDELQQYRTKHAEMKQAVVLDLKLARSSASKEQTNLALVLIQTQLSEAKLNWLKKRDDRIAFRMLKFNHHKSTGNVWHSPSFYYKDGYKMCLAVYPSELRTTKVSNVTLFLLLIKGEYDSDLKWPIQSNFELSVSIIEQQAPVSKEVLMPSSPSAKVKFCSKCAKLDSFHRPPAQNEEKREVQSLGSFKIRNDVEVVGDSIVLFVRVTMHQHA